MPPLATGLTTAGHATSLQMLPPIPSWPSRLPSCAAPWRAPVFWATPSPAIWPRPPMPACRLPELFFPAAILSVQPPRQLETLDDLLAQAGHYAEFCMRNSGKMSPTLFLIGADGPLMFVPASLADETEKDAFATTCRLLCIAHAATACVMALESWMKTAKPGEPFDLTERP